MHHLIITFFASTYGSGAYDGSTYNGATSSTSGGGLSNTGIMLIGIISFACAIIFVTLLIRISGRKKKTEINQA